MPIVWLSERGAHRIWIPRFQAGHSRQEWAHCARRMQCERRGSDPHLSRLRPSLGAHDMGSSTRVSCRKCRHHLFVQEGGGFSFHLLHCDRCGRTKSVNFTALGNLHAAYLKGLPGPYAMASWQHDLQAKTE